MVIDIERAAALLLEMRASGQTIPELPDGLRPGAFGEAYAIQDALHDLAGTATAVLKVGCTSTAAQTMLAIDQPIAGRLDRAAVFGSPAVVPLASFHHPPLLECELGLRIGSAGTAGRTVEEAVDAVVPAIELVDSRYQGLLEASGPSLVADNSVAAAAVLAQPVPIADIDGFDHRVTLTGSGSELASGSADAVLGGPFGSLAWAIAHERALGRDLAPGTVVITGTCTGMVPVPVDQRVVADFGPLGRVEATVST